MPVCAILGVGPGNGIAIARRFDAAGHALALCARRGPEMEAAAGVSPPPAATPATSPTPPRSPRRPRPSPATSARSTPSSTTPAPEPGATSTTRADALRDCLEVNAVGLFSAAKAFVPGMRRAGQGALVVIGAGAALRGRPGTIAFAAGKAAQRSVAQSLARQLGPENIHVAYVVLDGVVDLATTRARMPDKPPEFFLASAGVADAVYTLATQDRQSWTFELDLRPYVESW